MVSFADKISLLLRKYPMWAIAFALIAGILLGESLCPISLRIPVIICCITFVAAVATCKYKIFTAFAAVFFISTGLCITAYKLNRQEINISDETGTYRLLLCDYPTIKPSTVKAECLYADSCGSEYTILLTLPRDTSSEKLTIGDVIAVNGLLSMPHTLNPEGFDYGKYLRTQGYSATLYANNHILLQHNNQPDNIRTWGRKQQHKIVGYYKKAGFRSRELGVISALTIGERDLLDSETRYNFSAAGAMHVLAVSGLHVGIIYLILFSLFTGFGKLKPLRKEWWLSAIQSSLIIIALWIYAIVTGLSPSVVRATLMFSLGEIGRLLHRSSFGLNIVGASAVISLIVNPLTLFTVSFQLSYCAVIAIMTIGQKITGTALKPFALQKEDSRIIRIAKQLMRYFVGIVTISVAAQIGTAPLTLYYFHQFSTWFCLTNIIILPFAEFIAFYSLVFLPFAPQIPQFAYRIMCDYIFWIESLPHSTINIWINFGEMLLLFGIIIAAYKQRLHYIAAILTILFTCQRINDIRQNDRRKEIIVYADRKTDIVQIINGRQQICITGDSTRAEVLTQNISLKYNLQQPVYDSVIRAVNIDGIGKVILITDSVLQGNSLPHTVKCNTLYLGDVGKISANRLLEMFDGEEVLLGGTMKPWKKQQIIELCKQKNISYSDLMADGAKTYQIH